MLTILNTLLGVILTGILGSYLTNKIGSWFQHRSNLNNIKIRKAEEHIKAISDLSVRINKSSSARRFAMLNLINALATNNIKQIEETRFDYKREKENWNINLGSFNIELNLLNFFHLAIDTLEDKIHHNFVMAHNCINNYLKDKDSKNKPNPKELEKAGVFLNNVVKETNNICFVLIKESENIWKNLENDNSEPFSIDNLHRAKTWQLIFAIFYNPRSNSLRIKSSIND